MRSPGGRETAEQAVDDRRWGGVVESRWVRAGAGIMFDTLQVVSGSRFAAKSGWDCRSGRNDVRAQNARCQQVPARRGCRVAWPGLAWPCSAVLCLCCAPSLLPGLLCSAPLRSAFTGDWCGVLRFGAVRCRRKIRDQVMLGRSAADGPKCQAGGRSERTLGITKRMCEL